MTVIAFYNQKGGVGKTAATVNLAYLFSLAGWRTLLWDLDPQAAAGYYFQVESTMKNEAKKLLTNELGLIETIQSTEYENLHLVASDLSARNADLLLNESRGKRMISSALKSVKNDFDIVILDCPPGLSLIHDHIFQAADWVIMPCIPTFLSMRSYETVLEYFRNNKLDEGRIKCFFSMVDMRKNLHNEVLGQYARNKKFFKNYIPNLSDIEKMGQYLAPIEVFAPSSYAAECYRHLWKEIKKGCGL